MSAVAFAFDQYEPLRADIAAISAEVKLLIAKFDNLLF